MQLGMVGLGRMGANMVRRLMRNGHQCVVYESPQARRSRGVLQRRTHPGRLPSQLVRPVSQQMAWFVDGAAGSRLRCGKSRSSAGSEKP